MDDLFIDSLVQFLAGHCPTHAVRAIEAGESPSRLWREVEGSGFADAIVKEEAGGASLSLAQAFPLLEVCGAFALPVPLVDTILVRGVLGRASIDSPQGSIALAIPMPTPDGGLRCVGAPFGRVADSVLLAHVGEILLLPVTEARANIAVFPLDATLEWPASSVARALRVPGPLDIQALQACSLAAQISGALRAVFDRTLKYANERQQFGRPLGKFQAIQHQLSLMAEHVVAARMAAQIGCSGADGVPERLRVAVAKARTSEAAVEVAALSHSIHGAIGFTAECDLQLFTRRLNAWRLAGGSESYWQQVLGEELVERRNGPAIDLIRCVTDI